MAKDRRLVLSSKEEQKIEKAYLETAQGKVVFALTFVAAFAMLVGLLIETYKVSAFNTEFINPDSFYYVYSKLLFMWGGIAALIGLFFYIRFAIGYKNVKRKKTTKKVSEPVEKKPAAKKTTKKATTKATEKTTKSTKTTTKKK